jgi:predicted porin
MYKRLLASTALVAAGVVGVSAGAQAQTAPAAAPLSVTVGGYFEQSFGYSKNKDGIGAAATTDSTDKMGKTAVTTLAKPNKWSNFYDSEIYFNVKGTLANGITIGAIVQLEANTERDMIDESWMFIEGAFGRLDIGSTDEVAKKMAVTAPVAGKAASLSQSAAGDWVLRPSAVSRIDSVAVRASEDSQMVSYYTPRFEGLQLGASYVPQRYEDTKVMADKNVTRTNVWAAGLNFTRSFSGFDVAASLGYENAPSLGSATAGTAGAVAEKSYAAGLRLGFAGFQVGGGYKKQKYGAFSTDTGKAWEIGASYTFGPASVMIGYHKSDVEGLTAIAANDVSKLTLVGANYTLGPGVDLYANLFNLKYTDETSTAAADNNKGNGAIAGIRLTF